MGRDSKNICLQLDVRNSSFTLSDDGEGLNLEEIYKESLLLKNLNGIGQLKVRTRKKLGLKSEQLETDGRIITTDADRLYRNSFIIKDLYKSQNLRCRLAYDSLSKFETTLKAVVIENCEIDWKYSCVDSGTQFTIKMIKTKLGRSIALFKGKYQFIFETGMQNIKTLTRVDGNNYKGYLIILHNGIPVIEDVVKSNSLEPRRSENIFYINYSNIEMNTCMRRAKQNLPQFIKIKNTLHKPHISASSEFLRGTRESLELFKASEGSNVAGQKRDFLKDLIVIGQFDRKTILAKRKCKAFEEIWMFDQHACSERINLEALMISSKHLTRDEMNMRACKSATKFGDFLDINQQETIIRNLEKCAEPFHCAHGRPTCWLLARIIL